MNQIMLVLITATIIGVIIFVCREVSCWYFKINKRIELMETQNELLRKLLDKE